MQKAKQLFQKFLGIPVTIIAFIFIIKIFFDNKTIIINSFLSINLTLFTIGIFFFSSFFAIKSFVWIGILKKRGHTVKKRETIWHYSLSEVKRYIPGSIFAFIGRVQSLSNDVPQKETLKGIGIEAILLALSALIASFPALFYLLFKVKELYGISFFVTFGTIAFLIAIFVSIIYPRFRKLVTDYFDSLLLFILAWIIYALGCFFVAASFANIYPENLVFILSFFVLSWLTGYLLFITPMGLGIRELVTVGSLSLFLPIPIASSIAVMTRIGMVLGELLYLLFSYAFTKIKNDSIILKINPYFAILLTAAFLYFIFFTSYTIKRHDTYLSGRFDLGNMSQTVWNTSRGNFFMMTNADGTENISRLAVHSDFLLILISPLYLIWPDPKALLILQSLSLACGGIVVYFLSKEILKSKKLSLALSISFLLNFWIHEQNIFDFHAVTIATSLLLATFFFLIKRRYKLFLTFLILSVLTKENVFLVASFFGLYMLLKQKRIISGILLIIVPILIFFYLTLKAIPDARGNVHFALSYYSYLGGSTLEIVKNLILKPKIVLEQVFNLSTFIYLHQLLVPTGYLALLSPLYLVFTLPDLTINILSTNQNLRSYQYHYGAIIVPFIYIATIYGISFLKKIFKLQKIEKILFYYILFSAIYTCYFYSPLPGMKNADYMPYLIENSKQIAQYLSLIPSDASVSSSNNIGAHLSHRKNIYVIPYGLDTADYVALYGEKKSIVNAVDYTKYTIIVQDNKNNFYLFKKTEK